MMRWLFGQALLSTLLVLGCGAEDGSILGAIGGGGKGEEQVDLSTRMPIDIVFVGIPAESDPVLESIWADLPQVVAGKRCHLHRGVSLQAMVDEIIAGLNANNASVASLAVFGHGNYRTEAEGGIYRAQQVGHEWIAPMRPGWLRPDHHQQLERLGPYLSANAFVRLHGCSIAETPLSLASWSNALRGIPVWGGVNTQYGDREVLLVFEGPVVMCTWMFEPACLAYESDPALP